MGMLHVMPADPKKMRSILNRFIQENASVAANNFSGRRRPLPPINPQIQGGTAEVLITWNFPNDMTINGYNIYENTETNCVLSIANPVTGQVRIKVAGGSKPVGFFISSFNALKESIKVPVVGVSTSDLYVVTGTSGGTGGTSPSVPPGYTYNPRGPQK